MIPSRFPQPLALGLVALLLGCGSGGGADPKVLPTTATVTVEYFAPTAKDPDVARLFPVCAARVGDTHIHPSWLDFDRFEMSAVGQDHWTVTFTEVPLDVELSVRVSDPNACLSHPHGASTNNVFANDVELTREVGTPGTGIEPGLAFQVDARGVVSP